MAFLFLAEPVGAEQQDLSRPEEFLQFEIEIWKCRSLAADRPAVHVLADSQREIPQPVTRGIDTVGVKDQKTDRTVDTIEHLLYSIGDRITLRDQLCHELREVYDTVTDLTEGHALGKQLFCERMSIVEEPVGDYAEGAELRVDVDRLLFKWAYYSDSHPALHGKEIRGEFRLELVVAYIVDLPLEFFTEHGGTAELRPEMRMVICSVEEILAASYTGNNAEETAHV